MDLSAWGWLMGTFLYAMAGWALAADLSAAWYRTIPRVMKRVLFRGTPYFERATAESRTWWLKIVQVLLCLLLSIMNLFEFFAVSHIW